MIESAPWPIVRLAKGCVGTCGLTEYGGEYEDLQHRSLLGLGEAWHMHQEFIDLMQQPRPQTAAGNRVSFGAVCSCRSNGRSEAFENKVVPGSPRSLVGMAHNVQHNPGA